jgi:hypothetical protein
MWKDRRRPQSHFPEQQSLKSEQRKKDQEDGSGRESRNCQAYRYYIFQFKS